MIQFTDNTEWVTDPKKNLISFNQFIKLLVWAVTSKKKNLSFDSSRPVPTKILEFIDSLITTAPTQATIILLSPANALSGLIEG